MADSQLRSIAKQYTPVAVDLAALLLYTAIVPSLTARFQEKSVGNAIIIGLIYLLFCLAVYLNRKLDGATETYSGWKGALGFLAVAFGIFVTYMIAESGGILDHIDASNLDLDNPWVSLGLLVGGALWFLLLSLYAAILFIEIKPIVPRHTGLVSGLELLSLLGVNLMVIVTVAYWEAVFSGTEPYDSIATGGKILIFLLTYVFFLLFFAPPRLLFLARNPRPAALASFLIQTGYYVWGTLSRSAW